ncbi:helix-turn-helix transcriptional regulator [Catenulispora yoronensis]|uniref:Helix-turn-helix transcriptional regulator n=1 Tax=Catenulispora yoronensis TaxID=450799 RepID=A0ABN2UL68_9ACTN
MAEHNPVPTSFGAELRRRRLAAGMSISVLAERIEFSRGFISKVETGARSPSLDFVRVADAALDAGGEFIAMFAPRTPAQPLVPVAGMIRRHELATQGADGVVVPAGHNSPAAIGLEGDAPLKVFHQILKNLRDLGQVLEPSQVLAMLRPQIAVLRHLAQTSGPADARKAALVASHFAEYAGWMAQEMGDDVAALRWLDDAVDLGRTAGNLDLVAYANVRRANIALYQQDAYGTVSYARRVQTMDCSNRVKGLAAEREAQGHALAGDYIAFHRSLSLSADLLARSVQIQTPEGLVLGSTKVRDTGSFAEGWALHDLGRSAEAVEILTRLLDTTEPTSLRAWGRIGARLALALATVNDVRRSCEVIHPVLVQGIATRSATIRSDLRQLARILNRRRADPVVRKIMPDLSSALTPAVHRPAVELRQLPEE